MTTTTTTPLCQCGCGDPVNRNPDRPWDKPRKFLPGHQRRRVEPFKNLRSCPRCKKYKPREKFGKNRWTRDGRQVYCLPCMSASSKAHKEKCPEKMSEYQATRKARMLGVFVEAVNRLVVFERDEGICGICHKPVDLEDFHVDHVIALSKGGEHSYANVQVAHPRCNMRKYNNTP